MKYKLMAVDIDGTLLNSSGKLTQNTIDAVRKAVNKGLVFTIATGRPVQGVKELNDSLSLDLPFITYNGAMVVMGKSREILLSKTMNNEDAMNIYKKGDMLNLTVIVWSDNRLYVNRIDERALEYSKISGVQPEKIEKDVFSKGITKLIWYDDTDVIQELEKKAYTIVDPDKTSKESTFTAHTSRPYFLEFVDKKASKAVAMEKLGEHYNIKREEMIAIGDGFNDLSMIKYAGLGIAMENAPAEVRDAADYIAPSNDNDGLAFAIHKFVLNEI